MIGQRMVHVSLRLRSRCIALIDRIATKNNQSRTSVLSQAFILGLREYKIIYKLASTYAAQHESSDVLMGEHANETVPTCEHNPKEDSWDAMYHSSGDCFFGHEFHSHITNSFLAVVVID